jgi:hypothetical protein
MSRDDDLVTEVERVTVLETEHLRERWTALFGIEPAARLSRDLLIRGIAFRLQEQAHGGLSKSATRQLAGYAKEIRGSGVVNVTSSAVAKAGTKLIREWKGRIHEVTVLGDAFSWGGKQYGSLSEIARAITGTRWSGPRFFGLETPAARSGGGVRSPGASSPSDGADV